MNYFTQLVSLENCTSLRPLLASVDSGIKSSDFLGIFPSGSYQHLQLQLLYIITLILRGNVEKST